MPSRPLTKAQKPQGPSFPLEPKREAFCISVCNGMKLTEAHKAAGFPGQTPQAAYQLRHSPNVDARIRWMLSERVKADGQRFARRQKSKGDLLSRALQKLDDIMSTDVREVVDWKRETVMNADGEIVDVRERMAVRDAASLSPKAAAAIRGVFMKAGEVRVEFHDTKAAAVDIVKLLSGSDAQPVNNVTVNQVNVGAVTAQDAATRIAFLLASATARLPPMKTIEAEPVRNSRDVDEEPKDG